MGNEFMVIIFLTRKKSRLAWIFLIYTMVTSITDLCSFNAKSRRYALSDDLVVDDSVLDFVSIFTGSLLSVLLLLLLAAFSSECDLVVCPDGDRLSVA